MRITVASSAIFAFLLGGIGTAWGQETPVPVVTPMPVTTPMPMMTPMPVVTPVPIPTVEASPLMRDSSIKHEGFVAGDWIVNPRVFNEYAAGNPSNPAGVSTAFRGAAGFGLYDHPWLVGVDYRTFDYESRAGATVPVGGAVPARPVGLEDRDVDGRLAVGVIPHVYVGGSYEYRANSYGTPPQTGFGAGIEVTPDLSRWPVAPYGSVFYYPQLAAGTTLQYRFLKYQAGAAISLARDPAWPVFMDVGYLGDEGTSKLNAPSNFSHQGPYAGVGLHF